MKKHNRARVIVLMAIIFLFIFASIGEASAQSRDYGIHALFAPTYQVQKVYPLKIGIDYYGTCEDPRIWVNISDSETLLLGVEENRDGSNVGVKNAVEESPGYYVATFYPFHTEKSQLPVGSKGIVKWATIGLECNGTVLVWEETQVGLLIAPIQTFFPIFFGAN
jgi:hypothetical protein